MLCAPTSHGVAVCLILWHGGLELDFWGGGDCASLTGGAQPCGMQLYAFHARGCMTHALSCQPECEQCGLRPEIYVVVYLYVHLQLRQAE